MSRIDDYFDQVFNSLKEELNETKSEVAELYERHAQTHCRLASEALSTALDGDGDLSQAKRHAREAKKWFKRSERFNR